MTVISKEQLEEALRFAFADGYASADGHGTAPWDVSETKADLARLAALSPKPGETIGGALAWVFELANYIASDGTYTGWGKPQLSFTRPSVTESSIRNLRPLYLSAPPKGNAEGVKALEWRENPLGNWVAQSIVGQYFVFKDADDSTWAAAIPDVVARGGFKTADDAKTFAQTHFNSAIRSARTPSPISGEVAEGQWRSIESAPKDGTEIILYHPPEVYEGKPYPERVTSGAWQEWADTEECEGGANWASWDGGFREESPPTLWRPLPVSPATQPTQPEGDGR